MRTKLMAQAENNLQQRIYRLDRKLSAKQIEELKGLVASLGFRLVPIKADQPKRPYRFRTKFYRYDGISAAEAKGPRLIHVGKLCPGGLLWPADIANYYEALSLRRAA
jgi:hypothetical protein